MLSVKNQIIPICSGWTINIQNNFAAKKKKKKTQPNKQKNKNKNKNNIIDLLYTNQFAIGMLFSRRYWKKENILKS